MIKNNKNRDFAAVIGLDWSDEKHDFNLWDEKSNTMETGIIEHKPEVLNLWLRKLQRRYKGQPVAIGLEQSKGALAYLLMEHEFLTVYFINPSTVSKVRDAWTPSGAKDDPDDAELIMSIVRDSNHKLKVWEADTKETRQLKLLCEHRRNLVNLRVKLTNELRSCLKTYYPLACSVAGDKLNEPMALDFITKWPTLEKLQRSRETTIRTFYTRGNSRSASAITNRIKKIREADPITTDEVIIESYSMLALSLVAQLKTLRENIKEHDRRIAEVYRSHSDVSIISSFPAVGKVFGPRILAALGSDRNRFTSAEEIANYSGIAPVTKRSGKMNFVHRRWKCSKFIRQSFHEWANETTKHSLWARAFYIQAREKGMGHHQAVRALAFKWIRIIYACWKYDRTYDEMHYISMLKKRGSNLIKIIAEHPDAVRLNGPVQNQFVS